MGNAIYTDGDVLVVQSILALVEDDQVTYKVNPFSTKVDSPARLYNPRACAIMPAADMLDGGTTAPEGSAVAV